MFPQWLLNDQAVIGLRSFAERVPSRHLILEDA
jgi:hypothetical protein